MTRRPRLAALCALGLMAGALLGGCSQDSGSSTELLDRTNGSRTGTPAADEPGQSGTAETSYAVEPPGPFEPPLRTADVLITGAETLPDELVQGIQALDGVSEVLRLSVASAAIDGRTLNVAAVDPGEFRRFTPDASAKADFVWERLAGGEVAVDPSVSKKLIGKGDMMPLGNAEDSPTVHVGA